MNDRPKTLILGMGNTIRGDDAVGIEVVRRLREKINLQDLHIKETEEAGFNLLDFIVGYEKIIIVDSIKTSTGQAGDIYRFTQKDFKLSLNSQFSHGAGIAMVFAWAQKLKLPTPREIIFYAIEIEKADVFGEGLTKRIEEVIIPKVAGLIEEELGSCVDAGACA
ncbi:MAG: hydrogenase maturation protease [Candidatus Omnitrophota bacterium]